MEPIGEAGQGPAQEGWGQAGLRALPASPHAALERRLKESNHKPTETPGGTPWALSPCELPGEDLQAQLGCQRGAHPAPAPHPPKAQDAALSRQGVQVSGCPVRCQHSAQSWQEGEACTPGQPRPQG